ncbi:hypothetical protein BJ742DRAFT_105004 [Cladochytrium replicatum]|nr:hypothetical protein BJ742DRAFT_105004 [Cladochytrium replicatum]
MMNSITTIHSQAPEYIKQKTLTWLKKKKIPIPFTKAYSTPCYQAVPASTSDSPSQPAKHADDLPAPPAAAAAPAQTQPESAVDVAVVALQPSRSPVPANPIAASPASAQCVAVRRTPFRLHTPSRSARSRTLQEGRVSTAVSGAFLRSAAIRQSRTRAGRRRTKGARRMGRGKCSGGRRGRGFEHLVHFLHLVDHHVVLEIRPGFRESVRKFGGDGEHGSNRAGNRCGHEELGTHHAVGFG